MARPDDQDLLDRFTEVFVTGMRLKKAMLDRGLERARALCPRCQGKLQGALVGRKKHMRMWCEGGCGMELME